MSFTHSINNHLTVPVHPYGVQAQTCLFMPQRIGISELFRNFVAINQPLRMKKLTTIVLMACCSILSIQAQTIKKGEKFFDGNSLYTVQEVRMGSIVYMTTRQDDELTLEKIAGKNGEYKIIPSRQAEDCPIRFAEFGWRVQYVRQNGMNFLAVRKPDGAVMWTMVLTPDNEANCEAQQEALKKANWEDEVSNRLLNTPYLMDIPREQLRLMRNEILARHGYTFKSKDLRDYFSSKWWYKPGTNNATIKLNIIEQTNVELIKSEEAVEPGLHPADVAGDVDESCGIGDDGNSYIE